MCVCTREYYKHCDVKMFCFSCANHTSTNLKKFLCWRLQQLQYTLSTHSLINWNLENLYKTWCVNFFFCLSWHFKRENSLFWKASLFLQNKNWLCVQDFVHKTSWLVKISLLISAITKSFVIFLGKVNV